MDWPVSQKALEVVAEGCRRCISLVRLLAQTPGTNGRQVARQLGLKAPQGNGFLRDYLLKSLEGGLRLKRRPPREQFVQDGPESIHIGGRSDSLRLTGGLLWRHVAGRSQDRTRLSVARGCLAKNFGKAEIGDLWCPVPVI